MSLIGLRRTLIATGVLLTLASTTTLALAARRIVAEQSSFRAPAGPRCTPTTLNRSAVLPGTSLAVSPLPDSYDASPQTQISLLGAPVQALSAISVSGSQTGAHSGRLLAYSQGDGASFVPSRPFRSGETVTVHGDLKSGSVTQPFEYRFVVAYRDIITYTAAAPQPLARDYNERQHFHSTPNLQPPLVAVTASSSQTAPGDLFAAPYAGPGPSGPMILDQAGNLVWFDPLPAGIEATNLQVQQYEGKPVLTWWQGRIPPQGFGEGEEIIADSSYREIAHIYAGNGFKADLHDFHLMPNDTALLTVFDPIDCNVSALGGPRGGTVTDAIYQEIDVKTGLVRREWHSLDHVPLDASYSSARTASSQWPLDFFHVNSIDQLADGTTLISARNTWALYELNTSTGQVLTSIGGKQSNVRLGPGAATAFQHDAEVQPNGEITLFDNGALPKVHPQSRALVLSVNAAAKTVGVVAQYEHPGGLLSGSQGNVQLLPNGDLFVGWGAEPYFSEFSAGGQLLFDAHMHGTYQSYRTYRFPWTGTPAGAPAIAASAPHAGAAVTVYASWNGDTRTASWEVLAGPSPAQLTPVAGAARSGFETAITTPGPEPYVAVQALGASGEVLATSPTVAG